MKYLLLTLLCLLIACCNRAPSKQEIDTAVERISNRKADCGTIAHSLNVTDFEYEIERYGGDERWMCHIEVPRSEELIFGVSYDDSEMQAIMRYISLKKSPILTKGRKK